MGALTDELYVEQQAKCAELEEKLDVAYAAFASFKESGVTNVTYSARALAEAMYQFRTEFERLMNMREPRQIDAAIALASENAEAGHNRCPNCGEILTGGICFGKDSV